MATKFLKSAICVLAMLLAACGGGGGGASDAGSLGRGAWLTFAPAQIDLTLLPNTATSFSVTATSSKTIAETINVGIVDNTGVISPNASIRANSSMSYTATMTTNAALRAGTYTGNIEVRLCYDIPTVCARPVDGSPWQLPYNIKVVDASTLSYAGWETASNNASFLDAFALSSQGGIPTVVTAGYYTRVMETWTTADLGRTWSLSPTSSTPPLTQGFALASDASALYLSGGQSWTASFPSTALGLYPSHVWKFDGTNWQQQTAAAPFPGRVNHVMAKVGSNLFVAGGTGNGVVLRDIWKSSDEGIHWSKVADALPADLGTVTCALNWQGQLLLIGSKIATSSDGVQWTVYGNSLNNERSGSRQCAVLNGRLIVNSADSLNTTSSTDLTNWRAEFAPGPGFAGAPGMIAINGRLLITSGQGSSERKTLRTLP